MIEQGSGKILNVSSTSAFQPMPYMAAYGASKSYVYFITNETDKVKSIEFRYQFE